MSATVAVIMASARIRRGTGFIFTTGKQDQKYKKNVIL